MKFTSIFTVFCATTTFVLSILCLFAGTSRSFLPSADLLTLNISRIGHTELFNTTDSTPNGSGGLGGLLGDIVNNIEDDINDLVSDIASDIAASLNLSDFYSVHIMTFCQGYYEPNATVQHPSKNTTECSKKRAPFHFDPTKVLNSKLPDGITLSDLHWPDEIEDAAKGVRTATVAMFTVYVIGIGFAGLVMIGATLDSFVNRRWLTILNLVIAVLAFIVIVIASALATTIMVKGVDAANKYGSDIGIAASKGTTFLGMTWGATVAMLLCVVVSTVQCCSGRRKHAKYLDEKVSNGKATH